MKDFVNNEIPKLLDLVGASSIDELMVSERDGQPLVIYYGKEAGSPKHGGMVVHEQQGADGTRYVAFQSGVMREVPEAEFQQLVGGR